MDFATTTKSSLPTSPSFGGRKHGRQIAKIGLSTFCCDRYSTITSYGKVVRLQYIVYFAIANLTVSLSARLPDVRLSHS